MKNNKDSHLQIGDMVKFSSHGRQAMYVSYDREPIGIITSESAYSSPFQLPTTHLYTVIWGDDLYSEKRKGAFTSRWLEKI